MDFRKNGLWLTGQWGFTPEAWGVVGFTNYADFKRFFKNTNNGTIVAIYLTSTTPINTHLARKVVGFVKLSRENGCSKEFVCKKLWADNQKNLIAETAGKWIYGVQITQAWKVVETDYKNVKDIFNHTYDPKCGMKIAAQGIEVKEEDFDTIKTLRLEATEVFKQNLPLEEHATVGDLLKSCGLLGK